MGKFGEELIGSLTQAVAQARGEIPPARVRHAAGPFLMPCEPGSPRRIDPAWDRERACILALGHDVLLVDHDALERGDTAAALARTGLAACAGQMFAWRGWMVRAEDYALLCDAVQAAGCRMLDTPAAYAACHHAPALQARFAGLMAPTHVLPLDAMEGLDTLLLSLTGTPLVVKDWVKSQASLWAEACFIPEPGDLPAARKVVDRFLELQGSVLTGGLVFREYVPLVPDASGRAAEWRAFVVDRVVAAAFQRSVSDALGNGPPATLLDEVVPHVPARFWCMDWAKRRDGSWLLLEVGYGGVSEVPEWIDPAPVLEAVADACSRTSVTFSADPASRPASLSGPARRG